MRLLLLSLMATALMACQTTSKQTSDKSFHGVEFVIDETISVDEMTSKLDKNQPIEGLIMTGTVVDVCQTKGCWLTLQSENGGDVRVTFKDYGFFVPKDISGKQVVVKGIGKIEITSVADLQHFAEDEGQSKEEIAKITEPIEEYTFVAEGVKIK